MIRLSLMSQNSYVHRTPLALKKMQHHTLASKEHRTRQGGQHKGNRNTTSTVVGYALLNGSVAGAFMACAGSHPPGHLYCSHLTVPIVFCLIQFPSVQLTIFGLYLHILNLSGNRQKPAQQQKQAHLATECAQTLRFTHNELDVGKHVWK
jgi:hypothetical protein